MTNEPTLNDKRPLRCDMVIAADTAMIIDFKTDSPVAGPLAVTYPRYAAQLQLYASMLRNSGTVGARTLRLGVLLTATGEIRWLDEPAPLTHQSPPGPAAPRSA